MSEIILKKGDVYNDGCMQGVVTANGLLWNLDASDSCPEVDIHNEGNVPFRDTRYTAEHFVGSICKPFWLTLKEKI